MIRDRGKGIGGARLPARCLWLVIVAIGLIACQAGTTVSPPTATATLTVAPPTAESAVTPIAETATPPPTVRRPTPTPYPLARPVTPDMIVDKLGVDLGGVGDRALEFVDVAKTLRRWEKLDADECPEGSEACRWAPLDEQGWPTTDARTVFFDKRPFGAWWSADQAECPNCQDGDFQIDVSGTYKLSFTGQATLQAAEGAVTVENQVYDEATNTTTADIVVAPDQGLLFINFVDTRRTPDHDLNSGIADVHLIRPGYPPDTTETFTPYILEAVKPFDTLRFMNWVGGNNINPPFDSDADCTLDWAERNPPDARQNQGEGVAWEYVIELANLTAKNIWVNIPIHASDDYIAGLARLLNTTLHEDAIIYIEHSNEVWNSGFDQERYNRLAAQAEVEAGGSTLNNDKITFAGTWAQRRHVRRLMEISNLFRSEFGDAAINTKVRVIHSWWAAQPLGYQGQLQWLQDTYGPPKQFFYALAAAGYFNINGALNSDSDIELYERLRRSSNGHASEVRAKLQQIADLYGLKHAMYEGGPDTSKPLQWDRDTGLLLTAIDIHRDPRMRDLILYDLWNNWFAHPGIEGDMFIYFTLQSQYNRWGMWGLTEDITDLQTPKYRAITDLVGMTTSVPPSPIGLSAHVSAEGVVLSWPACFSAVSYTVKRGEGPDGPFIPVATDLSENLYVDTHARGPGTIAYVVSASNDQGEGLDSFPVQVDLP